MSTRAAPSPSDAERTRARLRTAGLLAEVERYRGPRPSQEAVSGARRAAAVGKPLNDYVVEGRS